ncbi:uncharacterized protein LOC127265531 [Andrographis paniculata]|uniref:uncharacterized protein LOC127265531 n=1 Tax=Andrographis paniculata TaxID=175694 RepID=UPI0021E96B07|nr:uncharacterized protein LOC127265531 [Andrographis paniculata]XP_051151313.1 uncharacterized protein LOC127265531 [Andrographis paniculata]
MDSLTLSATLFANGSAGFQLFPHPFVPAKKSKILAFQSRKSRELSCSASKGDANLDDWDRMELKFGRMIGEDPKITLAKIMGRKLNPDMSYLEIEKLLARKKGKSSIQDIEEIPFDVSDGKQSTKSDQGMNLVRPAPRKETEFEATSKPGGGGPNLVRPVPRKGIKFEATSKPGDTEAKSSDTVNNINEAKSSVPDVILRKPRSFYVNDDDSGKDSILRMKPNLSLNIGKEAQYGKFSDITLLKKPEPMANKPNDQSDSSECSDGIIDEIGDKSLEGGTASVEGYSAALLQKPELHNVSKEEEQESSMDRIESSYSNVEKKLDNSPPDNQLETSVGSVLNQSQETDQTDSGMDKGSETELQADKLSGENTLASGGISTSKISLDTSLTGKPKRLDRTSRVTDQNVRGEVILLNTESLGNPSELENFLTESPIKEREDADWARAEVLVKTGERAEVELISSSIRGFVASFGSLIGFLPYRNLAARWKFIAFESWLRRKGLDPSNYRQNLGIIGTYETTSRLNASESSVESEVGNTEDRNITSDVSVEDLLMIYDQKKLKFLSSFVGQRIKVGVVLADRRTRKLIFSIKPKEKEELVEKKRNLMAKLGVGDVVKCCIKKITYFGIFVEVEEVPALIHQTEVSWDATLDPASYFKVGQIVEAKVHQLDFSLERIFLSLKEVTPDPLTETLEAVVGEQDPMGFRLEAAEADSEWADVESLIKELEQVDGIQSVTKGRYFLSPGLTPTFQVYMASMFQNQYKLLARAGNRVQEVIVETSSLSKEELKSVIMTCTNRVE